MKLLIKNQDQIEFSVLSVFFSEIGKEHSLVLEDYEKLISKREFSEVGYLTELTKKPLLNISGYYKNRVFDGICGKIDQCNFDVGFVIYLSQGYVSEIESFSYGDYWPLDYQYLSLYIERSLSK